MKDFMKEVAMGVLVLLVSAAFILALGVLVAGGAVFFGGAHFSFPLVFICSVGAVAALAFIALFSEIGRGH